MCLAWLTADLSSDSDDDDEDEEDDEDEDEGSDDEASGKRKRGAEDDEEDEEEEDNDDDEELDITDVLPAIAEVATDPLYPTSLPELFPQACVLCPERALKHEMMAASHLASASHARALKRWNARLAAKPVEDDADPREVVEEILAQLVDAAEVVSGSYYGDQDKADNTRRRTRARSALLRRLSGQRRRLPLRRATTRARTRSRTRRTLPPPTLPPSSTAVNGARRSAQRQARAHQAPSRPSRRPARRALRPFAVRPSVTRRKRAAPTPSPKAGTALSGARRHATRLPSPRSLPSVQRTSSGTPLDPLAPPFCRPRHWPTGPPPHVNSIHHIPCAAQMAYLHLVADALEVVGELGDDDVGVACGRAVVLGCELSSDPRSCQLLTSPTRMAWVVGMMITPRSCTLSAAPSACTCLRCALRAHPARLTPFLPRTSSGPARRVMNLKPLSVMPVPVVGVSGAKRPITHPAPSRGW